MKILHILDHSLPLHSGYTFRSQNLFRAQRKMGYEPVVLTSPKHEEDWSGEWAEKEEINGFTYYRTGATRHLPGPIASELWLMHVLSRRILDVAEIEKPDIIHAHSPVLNGIPAIWAARKCGLPVVYEIRAFWEDAAVDHGTAREWGPRYRLTRWLESRALRRADAVTTICEGLRRDMLERGIPADRITVIPNAVDVSGFRFRAPADAMLAKQYGLTHGKTLGFAGSFYAYEGLDYLLHAMPQVLQAEPKARLMLVGGGPQEARLKALVTELGIGNAVHFTGRVPHADVSSYYSVMDVMVYPRVPRRLTQLVTPLKPLEAMALGKLVVASDVGGHGELIRDGYNGHLFRAGSTEALAACLINRLNTPDTWGDVINNGRTFVERERTWQASAARYRAVYADALDRRRHFTRGRTHDR